MSTNRVAHDPSVADYRTTSPRYAQGGRVATTPAFWPFHGPACSKQAAQFATAVDDGNDLDFVPADIKFVQDQIVAFDEHA